MIQIGGVHCMISAKRRAYFCRSIAIGMRGVSLSFSKVSGSGVDLILLKVACQSKLPKFVGAG